MERWSPWWREEEDPTVEAWERSPVKWVPKEVAKLSLDPFSLNFVSGPRQVGKTTLVKLAVRDLLLAGKDRRSVLYLSCDELSDHKELGEVLDGYLNSRKSWSLRRSYIFLDEVTFVSEWWRAVKARIDSGALRGDVVTVTGSASIDPLRQKEYFPGRRGRGVDLTLMPLDFASYLDVLSPGLKERKSAASLLDVGEAMAANRLHAGEMGRLFLQYLETGGFPLSMREMAESGRVTAAAKSLLDGIRGDWVRAGRSEGTMKEVVRCVVEARGNPVSWLGLARGASIGSPHTSRAYVETLRDLLLLTVLEFIRPDGQVVPRKNRKLHFVDPFVAKTLARYAGVDADEPAVAEGVVASHIARPCSAYYWKNGSEVDVVSLEGKKQVGVEVKWGFKAARTPRHLHDCFVLDKAKVPVFLGSLAVTPT